MVQLDTIKEVTTAKGGCVKLRCGGHKYVLHLTSEHAAVELAQVLRNLTQTEAVPTSTPAAAATDAGRTPAASAPGASSRPLGGRFGDDPGYAPVGVAAPPTEEPPVAEPAAEEQEAAEPAKEMAAEPAAEPAAEEKPSGPAAGEEKPAEPAAEPAAETAPAPAAE